MKAKKAHILTRYGFQVRIFRDAGDGMVDVEILTHDAKPRDEHLPGRVPRFRLIVNDHSDVTTPDGGWQSESVGFWVPFTERQGLD